MGMGDCSDRGAGRQGLSRSQGSGTDLEAVGSLVQLRQLGRLGNRRQGVGPQPAVVICGEAAMGSSTAAAPAPHAAHRAGG